VRVQLPPPPPLCTKRTRRVPHPVLIGHAPNPACAAPCAARRGCNPTAQHAGPGRSRSCARQRRSCTTTRAFEALVAQRRSCTVQRRSSVLQQGPLSDLRGRGGPAARVPGGRGRRGRAGVRGERGVHFRKGNVVVVCVAPPCMRRALAQAPQVAAPGSRRPAGPDCAIWGTCGALPQSRASCGRSPGILLRTKKILRFEKAVFPARWRRTSSDCLGA